MGSWACIHRWNELIAARRWLRVETLLCRADLEPVQEGADRGGVDAVEGESFGRDGSLVAEEDDQELEGVPVGRDGVR